jgi:hypothetical protein
LTPDLHSVNVSCGAHRGTYTISKRTSQAYTGGYVRDQEPPFAGQDGKSDERTGAGVGWTDTEHMIASVWRDVLGLTRVGTADNFFDVGGTSRAAVIVREHLCRRLDRPLSEVELFQYPTIGALAAYLDGAANRGAMERAARRGAARHVPGRLGAGHQGPRLGRSASPVRHGEE